jgi:hypothetical protein
MEIGYSHSNGKPDGNGFVDVAGLPLFETVPFLQAAPTNPATPERVAVIKVPLAGGRHHHIGLAYHPLADGGIKVTEAFLVLPWQRRLLRAGTADVAALLAARRKAAAPIITPFTTTG